VKPPAAVREVRPRLQRLTRFTSSRQTYVRTCPPGLRWVGAELSAQNRRVLYVPEGFAQGYQTRADERELSTNVPRIRAACSPGRALRTIRRSRSNGRAPRNLDHLGSRLDLALLQSAPASSPVRRFLEVQAREVRRFGLKTVLACTTRATSPWSASWCSQTFERGRRAAPRRSRRRPRSVGRKTIARTARAPQPHALGDVRERVVDRVELIARASPADPCP
jgi:hypothetical protein